MQSIKVFPNWLFYVLCIGTIVNLILCLMLYQNHSYKIFYEKGKCGVMAGSNIVISPNYDELNSAESGYEFFYTDSNSKKGLIKINNKIIVSAAYRYVDYYPSGKIAICDSFGIFHNAHWNTDYSTNSVFNSDGNALITSKDTVEVEPIFKQKLKIFSVFRDDEYSSEVKFLRFSHPNKGESYFIYRYGLYSLDGKILQNDIYENMSQVYFERLIPFAKRNKLGYFDEDGKIIISPQFDYDEEAWLHFDLEFARFRNGYGVVWKNGKCGYINQKGDFAISPEYDFAFPFHENLAVVSKDNKYGVINKSGKIILPLEYETTLFKGHNDSSAFINKGVWRGVRKINEKDKDFYSVKINH